MTRDTPADDPFEIDEPLAAAIDANRTEETVRENARLVGVYHQTLMEHGMSEEAATELTCTWLVNMLEENT